MRQIKFRAFSRIFNENKMFFDVDIINKEDGQWFSFFNGTRLYQSGESVNIMQFTGLQDKNGVDVYEGDILQDDNETKYTIKWIEQLAAFYLSIPNTQRGKEVISCAASKSGCEPMRLYKIEIIGNIYQTPE